VAWLHAHVQPGDSLVSGGARGPDTWAEEIARELEVPITVHRPAYQQQASNRAQVMAAIRRRNQTIAEDCDVVVALVAPDRKGGTEMTVRAAEKLGRRVILL